MECEIPGPRSIEQALLPTQCNRAGATGRLLMHLRIGEGAKARTVTIPSLYKRDAEARQ